MTNGKAVSVLLVAFCLTVLDLANPDPSRAECGGPDPEFANNAVVRVCLPGRGTFPASRRWFRLDEIRAFGLNAIELLNAECIARAKLKTASQRRDRPRST